MSEDFCGKNDSAWRELFKKYDILNRVDAEGEFFISASHIKEFREPRLMAKFDHSINLPKIFQTNKLAILPTARGEYVISHFDAYHKLEQPSLEIYRFSLPDYLQSIDPAEISSEAVALNCAVASGVIADFLGEPEFFSTVSGRMGSGNFSFNINDVVNGRPFPVNVRGAQIEIDAAYEGVESLAIVEAKRDISDDFLVRQLYYPFRSWGNRVSKEVRTIFLIYSNGVFRLYEYCFENVTDYCSLVLVKQKNYSIEYADISISDIESLLSEVKIQQEPRVAFPQADKFERVINICELLKDRRLTRGEVTEQYAFDVRQTNYYTDAGRYLGLIEKSTDGKIPVYQLSFLGRRVLGLCFKSRQLEFCKCILSHKVYYDTLKYALENGKIPDKEVVVSIMKRSNLFQVESDSTFERRASTVRGWIGWILSLPNETA